MTWASTRHQFSTLRTAIDHNFFPKIHLKQRTNLIPAQ